MTSVSIELAKFVSNLQFESLTSPNVMGVKKCLLDLIGVAMAGSTTDLARILSDLVIAKRGVQESTIIGKKTKVPSDEAALVNGVSAHVLELDDGHRFAMGHPGATVIPAALAVAETIDANGKDLTTAIACGYEVFSRIAIAVNPSHMERGFHTTGTCGTFGATAAAGKILGLNERQLSNALGIAGIQAAGLMEVMRGESIVKPLQPGRAAQSGVMAVQLAKEGVTAPGSIIEGDKGFCKATSDRYSIERITRDLGKSDLEIMRVYFKLYPACRHIHPSLDAVLELVTKHDILPEQVDAVKVKTYKAAVELCGGQYQPKTVSTAKFSLPYCIATAIINREVTLDMFTGDRIKDERTLALASRVRIEVDPIVDHLTPEKRGSIVEVIRKDGKSFTNYIQNPRGEPEVPVSLEDLRHKFRDMSKRLVPSEEAERISSLIERVESIRNIEELTHYLG